MAKIETLKDLMIESEITRGDMSRIARNLFDGISSILDGDGSVIADAYEIRLPRFDDLPEREQGYLIKVLLECPIVNRFDCEVEDTVADTDSTRTSVGPIHDLPENTELDSELLD